MRKLILIVLCATTLFAQAGPTYFYAVSAVGTNGLESGNSNEVSATLGQGKKNVVLTWTAGTGGSSVAGYNVYRSQTTGGPYTKVNAALVTGGTTFTDSFLAPSAPTLAAPTVN